MAQAIGPRVLAEQKMSIWVLVDYDGPLDSIPLDTLEAGLEASCRAVAADTSFTATDSDTTSDPAVCEPLNAEVLGASNYDASIGLFRYADETDPGIHSTQYDDVYQALKEKGTQVVVVIRDLGMKWDEPWAEGQEIEAYRVTTDNPQKPSDRSGYQKRTIPLAVQDAAIHSVVGPASTTT